MAFAGNAFLIFLLVQGQSFGAIVRKPPAFSTPIYSNSYLPASMQVIFHAVEQLKALEETSQNSSSVSSTTILSRKDLERPTSSSIVTTETLSSDITSRKPGEEDDSDQPIINETTESIESIDQTTLFLVSTSPSSIMSSNYESSQGTSLTSEQQIQSTTSEEVISIQGSDSIIHHQQQEQHEEPSEINEETPETNYATPEINHEVPEIVHVTQQSLLDDKTVSKVSVITSTTESNLAETSMKDETDESSIKPSSIKENLKEEGNGKANVTRNFRIKRPKTRNGSNGVSGRGMEVSKKDSNKKKLTLGRRGNEDASKKKPTVDSVVNEIYDIVQPTITSSSPASPIDDSDVTLKDTTDKLEVLEEEAEELRFTLLGEKVAQVPRPSLTSYLRIAKVPPKESLQRLADLYDALSKDARKQGFGKYAGYSDEVLKILETSAEGNAAKQLKTLLEKIMERNELTRDEARSKITEVLAKLSDPASDLNRDLESLKPLKYVI